MARSSRQLALAALIALAAILLALVACQGESSETEAFVVADLFVVPGKSLATAELSPTPSPTATIPNLPSPTLGATLPLPTVVVLQQPTLPIGTYGPSPTLDAALTPTSTPPGCTAAPPMPFTPIWQNIAQARDLLRCPVGDPQEVGGVIQFYEHGVMFWRQSDRSIFVLSELAIRQGQATDSWWRLDDTFQDGEPESDPGLQPPAGLLQPVRGFGKVWRHNAFVREAVGWATTEELWIASLWQNFEGGWMMTGPDGAPIYVMSPLGSAPYSTGLHLGPMP